MRLGWIAAGVLLLAACGGGGSKAAELPAGHHDLGGDVTVTVQQVKDPVKPMGPASEGYPQPASGDRWIAVELTATNDSGDTVSVPLTVSELRTVDGQTAQPVALADPAYPEPGWQIPGGKKARGWIAFELPAHAEPDVLLVPRRQGSTEPPITVQL